VSTLKPGRFWKTSRKGRTLIDSAAFENAYIKFVPPIGQAASRRTRYGSA
jgi:hypothetical protein